MLIHARASGVGTAAIQLTVAAGAHAIVTVGSQKNSMPVWLSEPNLDS